MALKNEYGYLVSIQKYKGSLPATYNATSPINIYTDKKTMITVVKDYIKKRFRPLCEMPCLSFVEDNVQMNLKEFLKQKVIDGKILVNCTDTDLDDYLVRYISDQRFQNKTLNKYIGEYFETDKHEDYEDYNVHEDDQYILELDNEKFWDNAIEMGGLEVKVTDEGGIWIRINLC